MGFKEFTYLHNITEAVKQKLGLQPKAELQISPIPGENVFINLELKHDDCPVGVYLPNEIPDAIAIGAAFLGLVPPNNIHIAFDSRGNVLITDLRHLVDQQTTHTYTQSFYRDLLAERLNQQPVHANLIV